MATATYHVTTFGSFAPRHIADRTGFVRYHVSPRYAAATAAKLEQWASSRSAPVRNAAITELAQRRLNAWRAAH